MSTKRSTQTIVKVGNINDGKSMQSQLEIRAARFGIATGKPTRPAKVVTSPVVAAISKVDPEKAAARAKRFADVAPDAKVITTNSSGATVKVNPVTAEKLAARAKRFADILPTAKTTTNATSTTNTASPAAAGVASKLKVIETKQPVGSDPAKLAARAARFADMGKKV